jgi:uncharacterized peroxidase-related enzyme
MTKTFSLALLDWKSHVDPVPLAECTPEQISVLEESNSAAKESEYYLTLVHDAPALRARSRLFNAVMYGRGGAQRQDRELAATAESILNGCEYCTSVHARLFVQLSKDEATMQRMLSDGLDIELNPKRRAIVDYAVRLAATPSRADTSDIAALRAVGLSSLEIMDITNAIAMFAWANRLMLTLGEPYTPAT